MFKPHPESTIPVPQVFIRDFGVKIVEERFEEMAEKPDLYLFDVTNTSVFKPCLLTNIPVAIIDFDVVSVAV